MIGQMDPGKVPLKNIEEGYLSIPIARKSQTII
jgi:hypothetical protein